MSLVADEVSGLLEIRVPEKDESAWRAVLAAVNVPQFLRGPTTCERIDEVRGILLAKFRELQDSGQIYFYHSATGGHWKATE